MPGGSWERRRFGGFVWVARSATLDDRIYKPERSFTPMVWSECKFGASRTTDEAAGTAALPGPSWRFARVVGR